MTERTREILRPSDARQGALDSLLGAAEGVARMVCEDDATLTRLREMLSAGAVLEVRVALPAGKVAVQLVRDGQRETLATIDPTPMRPAVN